MSITSYICWISGQRCSSTPRNSSISRHNTIRTDCSHETGNLLICAKILGT
ncbi:unnamed protein product [Cylicostephanus goldi]|uniref:Uncharacterized protein n=1 Tax=Cylicostephanus goldi TaxID=71465 RepID=A0A3P7MFK0_CYLGO|nr:unnamed protein product [Cylicostephanus goldi]